MTPLDRDRLLRELGTRNIIATHIEILAETDSTNERCHERADDGEGLVIVAEHQTAGRGQRGNRWSAPPMSSLLFSVLLTPPEQLSAPSFLTAWAASAVSQTMRGAGLSAVIKWPNDILINGHKVAGILVEKRQATVVGIGVNVHLRPDQFPENLRMPATSLDIELTEPADRTTWFARLLVSLDDLYSQSLKDGPEIVYRRWSQLAENLVGQIVVVTTSSGEAEGVLTDFSPRAGVELISADGSRPHFLPEWVLRVRPKS